MARPLPERIARRRAAAVAGHLGDLGTARALLHDDDPSVRATALAALARARQLEPGDLLTLAADADPAVRRRVAEVAAGLAAPAGEQEGLAPLAFDSELFRVALATVEALLDDDDDTVVEVASWATGELLPPTEGAFARLAQLALDHADALVREAAVAALGAIGDERALPVILAAFTGDKGTVRRRAVLALAPFDGPEVEAALTKALDDRDWQVRQNAQDLLSATVVDLSGDADGEDDGVDDEDSR